jgi:5-methylcytosine-specific restriction endonuclease McrA
MALPSIVCGGCGSTITPRRKDQTACNRACWVKSPHGQEMLRRSRQQYRRSSAVAKAARASEKMRARARRTTTVIDPFRREDVFARDGYVCWICNEACTNEQVPAAKAATVDHVVPLSQGGSHTMANVRCAHFVCNSGRRVSEAC